jgi:antitoxin ParD1/3/4
VAKPDGSVAASSASHWSDMPTRKVVMSHHQHELVEGLVRSGRYQNASEVLREGLRLIEELERVEHAKLKALKQALIAGVRQR